MPLNVGRNVESRCWQTQVASRTSRKQASLISGKSENNENS